MLFFTIPHSGEKIPDEAFWLKNLDEKTLLCDVDRFVDQLYVPILTDLQIPYVKTEWHRYAVDLNRIPEDIDQGSVENDQHPRGTNDRGFHWVKTTLGQTLMSAPMTNETHQRLVDVIYKPFHANINNLCVNLKSKNKIIYHIDAHSMPSRGTSMHRDPGEDRADIVISDQLGKSCSAEFRDMVIAAYVTAGFKVGYNWPYIGGRVTEQYGNPQKNHHTIQVELNRKLYMDESSKEKTDHFNKTQDQLRKAVKIISDNIVKLKT